MLVAHPFVSQQEEQGERREVIAKRIIILGDGQEVGGMRWDNDRVGGA